MLTLLIICAIAGGIGGLLQGMVGVGTGVIVIPLLTWLLPHYGVPVGLAIHVALATSMAAIVISSAAAALNHHRHQNICWGVFNKLLVYGIVGSAIGAFLASYLPARMLEVIFAVFMFYVAFKMLAKHKISENSAVKALTHKSLGGGGFLIGVSASIVGIGGGLFMVPFLRSKNLEMRQAVGTATIVGLPVAVIGSITYVITGLSSIHQPMLLGYLHWPAFIAISSIGVIFAAWGAQLSKRVNPVLLQRIFAICIIAVGIKMLIP